MTQHLDFKLDELLTYSSPDHYDEYALTEVGRLFDQPGLSCPTRTSCNHEQDCPADKAAMINFAGYPSNDNRYINILFELASGQELAAYIPIVPAYNLRNDVRKRLRAVAAADLRRRHFGVGAPGSAGTFQQRPRPHLGRRILRDHVPVSGLPLLHKLARAAAVCGAGPKAAAAAAPAFARALAAAAPSARAPPPCTNCFVYLLSLYPAFGETRVEMQTMSLWWRGSPVTSIISVPLTRFWTTTEYDVSLSDALATFLTKSEHTSASDPARFLFDGESRLTSASDADPASECPTQSSCACDSSKQFSVDADQAGGEVRVWFQRTNIFPNPAYRLYQYVPIAPADTTYAPRYFDIREYDVAAGAWSQVGSYGSTYVNVYDGVDPYYGDLSIHPCTNYNEYERFNFLERPPPPAPPPGT